MKCKKILLVDDDEDIRLTIGEALEMSDYKVMKASNGQEALSLIQSLPEIELPGLIILDLMMPIMDGIQFLNAIHTSFPEFSKIPIVLASAKGSVESLPQHALTIERIKKPMDLEDLLRIAETYCGMP